MKRNLLILGFVSLAFLPFGSRADEAPRCTSSGDEDSVSIACNGANEQMGNQPSSDHQLWRRGDQTIDFVS